MKIRIRYETQITTIDVPEEEFDLMIRLDYEKQLAEAKDPAAVRRRAPQEIIDERFNRPDYNNWHAFHRHWEEDAVPPTAEGIGRRMAPEPDADGQQHHFTMDEFPDLASPQRRAAAEQDEEVRAWIRRKMKPDYAEMLISIHMDGIPVIEYAARIGETRNTVSHRLQRAEKNFRKFSKSVIFDPLP